MVAKKKCFPLRRWGQGGSLLACWLLMSFLSVQAGEATRPALTPQPAQAGATAPAASPGAPHGIAPAVAVATNAPNAITQAATSQGVLTCASQIQAVTQFLGFRPGDSAELMLAPADRDRHLTPMVGSVATPSGKTIFFSSSFAPNQVGGCNSTYDATVYWPEACSRVRQAQFSELRAVATMTGNIQVLGNSPYLRVFLMPAGKGCVSIKKEAVLQ